MGQDTMEIAREGTRSCAVQHAGLWRRAAAAAIDAVLLIAVSWSVVPALAGAWAGDLTEMAAHSWNIHPGVFGQLFPISMAILSSMACVAALVLSWIYGALMESSARQATIGKIALGIAVTDLDGRRISFGRGIARNLGKIAAAFPFLARLVMVGTTAKKQGLHDVLTGCLVVVKARGRQSHGRGASGAGMRSFDDTEVAGEQREN